MKAGVKGGGSGGEGGRQGVGDEVTVKMSSSSFEEKNGQCCRTRAILIRKSQRELYTIVITLVKPLQSLVLPVNY